MRNLYLYPLLVFSALIAALFPRLVLAQLDIQEWPRGQVILTSGDTLFGAVVYHHAEEILRLVHPDGTNQAFTAVGVRSFTVSDKRGEYKQVFRAYPWNRGNDYSDYLVPGFFEVLLDGPYTLVKREVISVRSQNVSPMYANYANYYSGYGNGYSQAYRAQPVIVDVLYLMTPQGRIRDLRNPRRDLEDLFGEKAGEMRQFVKSQHLSYSDTRDVIKILHHFSEQLAVTSKQ
ncbi:MAG: hypothetical protein ACO1O1_11815 [Adhaeribacter sp.]